MIHDRIALRFVPALVVLAAVPDPAAAQSFDCAKATSAVENMICSDAELQRLDSRMATSYTGGLEAQTKGDERLTLIPGQPPVQRSGTVVGDASVTYLVPGRKGQTLTVALKSANTSLYFNVLPMEDPTAIYASATEMSGNTGSVVFPADGDYRIVVYLFRNAARRGAKAAFTLSVGLK